MHIRQCLIVEDSKASSILLKSYLERLPLLISAKECSTYSEAVSILNSEQIDLVFLDINLPDFSGLELLKNFANLPPVIITSSHPEFAVDSYEIGKASDYLVKPFGFNRLMTAVNRALFINMSQTSLIDNNFILVKMGRTLQRFNLENIDYIEAFSIYSKIYSQGTPFVVNEIISALETKLNKKTFVRVHKSYIINTKKITNIDNKNIWINQTQIPLGRTYKPLFEGLLKLFDKNQ